MATPLPSPAQAAQTLQLDAAMLRTTREQARSAAFLALMLANEDQGYVLNRAIAALDEPEALPTQVYLIGRVYRHAAAVYAGRPAASKLRLEPDGLPAGELYQQRYEFLNQVSQVLTDLPLAA